MARSPRPRSPLVVRIAVADEHLPKGYSHYKIRSNDFAHSKSKNRDDNEEDCFLDYFLTPDGKSLRSRPRLLQHLVNTGAAADDIARVRDGLASDGYEASTVLPAGWAVKPSGNSHGYDHLFLTKDGEAMRGKSAVTRVLVNRKGKRAEDDLLAFLNVGRSQVIGGLLEVAGLPGGWSARRFGESNAVVISASGQTYTRVASATSAMVVKQLLRKEEGLLLAARITEMAERRGVGAGDRGAHGQKRLLVDIEPLDVDLYGRVGTDDDGEPKMLKVKKRKRPETVQAGATAKAETYQQDTPAVAYERLQEEKRAKEARCNKEKKSEAHLLMTVKVLLEEAFHGHQGNDLHDQVLGNVMRPIEPPQETAPFHMFKIRRSASLREFLSTVAEGMRLSVEGLRPWPLARRSPGPSSGRPLTPPPPGPTRRCGRAGWSRTTAAAA